ncbi:MAG: substrate-binding domain-containing protein [Ilumatobacteraceae bacterium]|nr:substrate-binding domain-containing protein [Ilumatobacteraceae bacterium]
MRKGTRRVTAAIFALGLVAAACGGDDSSSEETSAPTETEAPATSDAPAGGDEVAAAEAIVAELRTIPTDITVTVAPSAAVPTGIKVAWLACELPSCTEVGEDWPAIAEALGWELKVINVNSATPGSGVQEAIDWGANYISISGSPVAAFQEQYDAATAAGIKFAFAYNGESPADGILTSISGNDAVYDAGTKIANYMIADSGAAANVLMVNIQMFPVLVAEEEGIRDTLAAGCSACTFDVLPVAIEDIGVNVPGLVASYLQENPETNYVTYAFSALPIGVTAALESAGLLSPITQVGVDFDKTGLTEIVDGTHTAWTSNPKAYSAWLMAHAMILDALGDEFTERAAAEVLPNFVLDDAALAQEIIDSSELSNWKGPEGYADKFLALWGVA